MNIKQAINRVEEINAHIDGMERFVASKAIEDCEVDLAHGTWRIPVTGLFTREEVRGLLETHKSSR